MSMGRAFYTSLAVLSPDAAQPHEAIQMYEPPSAAPACGQAGSLGKPRFRFSGDFDTKAVNSAPGLDEPNIDGVNRPRATPGQFGCKLTADSFALFDILGPKWIRPDRIRLSLRVVEHPCHVKRMQINNC